MALKLAPLAGGSLTCVKDVAAGFHSIPVQFAHNSLPAEEAGSVLRAKMEADMIHDNDTTLQIYLTGLRNAHALENEAMAIMQRQIERIDNYPDVKKRLQQHLKETEAQAERLHNILQEFDDDRSAMKDVGGKIMGTLAAFGHSIAGDEILKNTFANYAFENYEIASYKSLITLAEATRQMPHIAMLEQSLDEEIAMASWIDENVGEVTLRFLELSEAGKTAKV
jgi:ferritin-like metal-binding protein YciE